MPELMAAPYISSRKAQTASGPVTAEASVGATQICGWSRIFGIWSIEVPIPWETRPFQPFSRKLMTAKPTICAQHPATAAAPAMASPSELPSAAALPVSTSPAQIAALEIGRVSTMPMTTETTSPVIKGACRAAQPMKALMYPVSTPIGGARKTESRPPVSSVTNGVTRISTRVFLETARPASAAAMAMKKTARGPPAPPSVLAAYPTAAEEKMTSGAAPSE